MSKVKSSADRGKDTENKVRKWLDGQSAADATFDYLRLPDARSARGYLSAMPCDMIIFADRYRLPVMLEVKETEQQTRLPHDKVRQLSKLKKYALTQTVSSVVVVFFSKLGVWKGVNAAKMTGIKAGSWDFSNIVAHETFEQALIYAIAGDHEQI